MKIIKDTGLFDSAGWTVLDDFYEDGGDFFDFMFAAEKKDDIPFYLNIAQGVGGDILEVACGSGRIIVPIAKNGFNIVGFDNSKRLLHHANRKIIEEKVDEKAHIFRGDMTCFALNKKFNMAIIAYNTFNHILSKEKQINSLMAINDCLASGGTFIMEVIHDRKFTFNGIVYRRTKYYKKLDVKIEAYSSTDYDYTRDIEKVTWFYLFKKEKKITEMFKSAFFRKLVRIDEIYKILNHCGFVHIDLVGDYKMNKESEEKKIFIAQKK